jgi:hypothetical protein
MSTKQYLGEIDVTDQHSVDPKEMALEYIFAYGQMDGDHHKAWVLDQVARILLNAPVTIKQARWSNGHTELRKTVGTSEEYKRWVAEYCFDEETGDPDGYEYNCGVAP